MYSEVYTCVYHLRWRHAYPAPQSNFLFPTLQQHQQNIQNAEIRMRTLILVHLICMLTPYRPQSSHTTAARPSSSTGARSSRCASPLFSPLWELFKPSQSNISLPRANDLFKAKGATEQTPFFSTRSMPPSHRTSYVLAYKDGLGFLLIILLDLLSLMVYQRMSWGALHYRRVWSVRLMRREDAEYMTCVDTTNPSSLLRY